MKGLKKLALASAVAAAPFAQAELVAMDDSVLGEMTGQAGVSIELSAQMSIGSFTYTDTDGIDGNGAPLAGTGAAGSFNVRNITLGGSGAEITDQNGVGTGAFYGTALDDIKIDIDVDANEGLVIHLGGTNTFDVLTGGAQAVDFALNVGSADVNGAVLASNINIEGFLGPIDIQIQNDSTINVDAYFEVTNGSMNIDVLGMGISNLTIGDDAAPILSGAYASKLADVYNYAAVNQAGVEFTTLEAQAAGAQAQATADQAAADAWTEDPGNPGSGVDVNGDTQADLQAIADASEATANTAQGAVDAIVAGSTSGVSNMAYVGMTITTGAAQYGGIDNSNTAAPVKEGYLVSNALIVSIDAMNMDIGADISLGTTTKVNADTGAVLAAPAAASLGSIAINDLDLSGTTLKIYGH